MNILLDTNIIIPLEDTSKILDSSFAELRKLSVEQSHCLYIHPMQFEDINRDKNQERRKIVLSRLKQYSQIENVRTSLDYYKSCLLRGIDVLQNAIATHDAPEIINSDQGCQFTCKAWIDACAQHPQMRVSMDGRSWPKDNIWIKIFWKTIKYEYIYTSSRGKRNRALQRNKEIH